MSDLVDTTSGTVRGSAGVFWDIPYAAPPLGAGRFTEPRPHPGWTGVREATGPGPTAPMPERRWFGRLDLEPVIGGWVPGDDYLTVNVWTPSTSGRAPVMVFVHGGAFLAGSGGAQVYDGAAFARDGVVLVTLNYRLGVPGWLSVPGAPENRGLLDVVAALRWVRENIVGFGGDPDQVTVFGQSAGGMIVGALLTRPDTDGLFGRAISQSGGLHGLSREQADRAGRQLAELLGVPRTAEAFAGVPDADLIAALPKLSTGGLLPFGPLLDADAPVRPGVELLLGNTSQEARLYQDPELEPAIDGLFRTASDRLAAAHGSARRYLFDWRGGPYGACHAIELPFVFERTDLPAFRGPDGLLGPDVPAGLATELHGAWVRFATTGDPGWQGNHVFAAQAL
ncbi:MAG TPA: carboxylesterase family protein [Pseudonocardia sp.]|nr:carboxylesterase family protein [Pseudonocardia sp.]